MMSNLMRRPRADSETMSPIKITLGPAADSAEAVIAAQDGEEQGGLIVFGRPSGERPLPFCPRTTAAQK